MTSSKHYHFERAEHERQIASQAKDGRAAEAHRRLSALHLSRAAILDEIDQQLGGMVPAHRN